MPCLWPIESHNSGNNYFERASNMCTLNFGSCGACFGILSLDSRWWFVRTGIYLFSVRGRVGARRLPSVAGCSIWSGTLMTSRTRTRCPSSRTRCISSAATSAATSSGNWKQWNGRVRKGLRVNKLLLLYEPLNVYWYMLIASYFICIIWIKKDNSLKVHMYLCVCACVLI